MNINTLKKIGLTFTAISGIIGLLLELGELWKKAGTNSDVN